MYETFFHIPHSFKDIRSKRQNLHYFRGDVSTTKSREKQIKKNINLIFCNVL
jgi:hypothetical protein